MVVEVNVCCISSFRGFRQSWVAASVVDDCAIVEDGGEVVVEVILLLHQKLSWFQTELWLLHQLLMMVL